MFELDKTSFGKFLAEERKAKGYTQKELAEKLFVSDKAVSKWERCLSMPDISLLIPLAEILEVSVTELLEGRRLAPESEMNKGQVETLVKKALALSEVPTEKRRERRRKHMLIFCSCALCMILECIAGACLLTNLLAGPEANSYAWTALLGGSISALVLGGLSFGFGIYFWFFIKERLPLYYDENKISVYSDGAFNLSLPGVCFNNSSWLHMVKALRIWSAATMTTAPAVCLLPALLPAPLHASWLPLCLQVAFPFLYLAGMFIPLYILGRKYGDENKDGGRRSRKLGIAVFTGTMLLLLLLVPVLANTAGETSSGIRIGYFSQYNMQEWSAAYQRLNGTVSKTIRPASGSGAYTLTIETAQGAISIEMTDRNGNVTFSASDIQSGTYEVTLSGATRIKVTGKDHKGSFSLAPATAPE